MTTVKRVKIGGMVKVDADGKGGYIFGKVSFYDAKTGNVLIDPSDGSAELQCKKTSLERATGAELNKFGKAKGATKGKSTPKGKKAKEEDEEVQESRSIVPGSYRETYKDGRLPSGRKTLTCGDKVAKELAGKTLEEVKKYVAKKMVTSAAYFTKRYGHLNRGHQRMAIGNAYRAWIKDGV